MKRLILTEEQQAVVERLRDDFKDAGGDYAYGVIDALAFVWAGMPEGAAELYAATMSQFSHLCKEVNIG